MAAGGCGVIVGRVDSGVTPLDQAAPVLTCIDCCSVD